jgi:uncharacterized protein YjfI (DUF2170 family)
LNDKLKDVVAALDGVTTPAGMAIRATIVEGESGLLKVEIEDREEFPIMIEFSTDQITAVANLWKHSDVKAGMEAEMMNIMLSMNIAMPLSSFAKTGGTYQLFGAMSVNTLMQNVVEEIAVLSDNTLAVFDALGEYLTS